MLRTVVLPALVAGGAAFALVGASSGSDSDDGLAIERARIGVVTTATTVDADRSGGTSVGDTVVFQLSLENADESETLGTQKSACTVVEVRGAAFTGHCTGTAVLEDGTVESAGLVTLDSEPDTVAITGGTGRYKEIDGEGTLTPLNAAATRVRLEVQLDR